MSAYDFERLTVVLAEDSPFIRSLLINSLKILGVGKVVACEDGGDAIEFLQKVKEDPMKVGCQNVDIVMSNWDMSPVDGMMFLRWVRRHKLSPDRFVPFVMITGYTEPKRGTGSAGNGCDRDAGQAFYHPAHRRAAAVNHRTTEAVCS